MASQVDIEGVIELALRSMGDTPRALEAALRSIASIREVKLPPEPLEWLRSFLAAAGVNNATEHAIGLQLRAWDRAEQGVWIDGSEPLTPLRRKRIYKLLKISQGLEVLFDSRLPPFTESEVPIVIAEDHTPWYFEDRRRNRFYWDQYCQHLREKRDLSVDDIAKLDEATDSVIERVSDPSQVARFQSKGLVVGYVQSGKTTHFTGVLAKAADAGYRLIIVLAGTMDILREQTQRRIDKELIGREFVEQEYMNDKDWSDFNSHGGRPSTLGSYDWQRLTTSEEDYQALRQGIAALEFKPQHRDKPFFDQANLRTAEARLIVIKKNPKVISRLNKDLERIKGRLVHVPSLVVDDESDQASINTIDPRKIQDRTRSETNRVIVQLLEVLPRAQYIGYTATPFANALINADDAADLFPREFMIALPRPKGYMGVADFYDEGPQPLGFKSNERAFVRNIRGDDQLPENLQRAIDMFVLSGAVKVFRGKRYPNRFKFEHHTMLVHHSPFTVVHEAQASEVKTAFTGGGYHGGKGVRRLQQLFEEDVVPVSEAREPDMPLPRSFAELEPHIGECLRRINADAKVVRIVNGNNKDDAPNFEKGSVWSILVGGAKLSRGYTIEGLTITYYRRVATAADTLMQMGRWFGFRQGYRDLVRLFIGRDEPIGQSGRRRLDLYEAFHALCQDEQEFRRDIQKYKRDGLKPIHVPPLVPSHLSTLAPTARNKMYNAKIAFRNFGGSRSERTIAPTRSSEGAMNENIARDLLRKCNWAQETFEYKAEGKRQSFEAWCGSTTTTAMLDFLKGYVWEGGGNVLANEIEYLEGKEGDPELDRWVVIAPLTKGEKDSWPSKKDRDIPSFPVRMRTRVGRRFKVFSEPQHVDFANFLARIDRDTINPVSKNISKWDQARTAVMLFYPVRDDADDFVTMGFALHFPPNQLAKQISWTVRRLGVDGAGTPVVIDKSSRSSSASQRGRRTKSRRQ